MAALPDKPRILAIHAHPDDIEFLCAGTLALLKQKGCHISMANMTPGDKGSAEHSAEEIANIRRSEGQKSADLLGAEFYSVEFRDLEIDVDNASRKRVTEILRKARPDIVITASPICYMTDHEVTSRLVRDACFCASVPNYKTDQWDAAPPTERIPWLYYMDPVDGIDWFGDPIEPHFVVDITKVFPLKLDMLACHESQRAWLQRQHGMDEYLDSCKRWSAKRGAKTGHMYGEGFRQHRGHPYPHDNALLEILER